MRVRKAGESDKAACAEPSAMALTCSMVSGVSPKVTKSAAAAGDLVFGIVAIQCGQGPEIVKVEPLQGRLQAMVFQARGIVGRQFTEQLVALLARQLDLFTKAFKTKFCAVARATRKHQKNRAIQQACQYVRANREGRCSPHEGRKRHARIGRNRNPVAGDDDNSPCATLSARMTAVAGVISVTCIRFIWLAGSSWASMWLKACACLVCTSTVSLTLGCRRPSTRHNSRLPRCVHIMSPPRPCAAASVIREPFCTLTLSIGNNPPHNSILSSRLSPKAAKWRKAPRRPPGVASVGCAARRCAR